jgi:hypothetical protein
MLMGLKRSRIHPTYKTQYRVENWAEYDRALVQRGDITLWLSNDAISAWSPRGRKQRGGQQRFSDLAIESALTLRMIFGLPLRQTEGFLRSIFHLMDVHLDVPDHTTLSRRGHDLNIDLCTPRGAGPVHLVIDSTGLSAFGKGEWAAAKHGAKGVRGWRKLHLGVDATGVIVMQALTAACGDDARKAVDLMRAHGGSIASVTGDGAYDTNEMYEESAACGARVVIPPSEAATSSRKRRPGRSERAKTIARVKKIGRRAWKKESGYHRQARAENAVFRFKAVLGGKLRSRGERARCVEARLGCSILNPMTALGRPVSYAI